MQILVTSPIPTHPLNHGNRARVFALCRALQSRGHIIHFVYSGLEGLEVAQENAMRDSWDHVHILTPKTMKRPQSKRTHHLIDDWYDEQLTMCVKKIMSKWRIDACFANYVWYSKWLDHLPYDVPTFIDTHDIFAERHQKLKADGITPQWFSTTKAEEAKGLNRAKTIFAIQGIEADELASRADATVEVLGHLIEPSFLQVKSTDPNQRLKVGFVASTNMVNVRTMDLLDKALTDNPALFEVADFYLAGGISSHKSAKHPSFNCLGFIESITDFYEDMDIVLNPNIGGSGLKIKSVEALAFGKPLLATSDAMIGIESNSPYHQFDSVDTLCQSINALDQDRDQLTQLAEDSRKAFEAYQSEQNQVLEKYFPTVGLNDEKAVG